MDYSSIRDFLSTKESKCESTYCDWLSAKQQFQKERRIAVNVWKKALKQLEKAGEITFEPDYNRYRLPNCSDTIKVCAPLYQVQVLDGSGHPHDLNDRRFDSCWCSLNREAKAVLEEFIDIISEA